MNIDYIMEKLVENNQLTIRDNKVCLKPHDKYSFTTYPLQDNDYIEISKEEYIGLITQVYMFNDDLDGIVDFVAPVIEEQE